MPLQTVQAFEVRLGPNLQFKQNASGLPYLVVKIATEA